MPIALSIVEGALDRLAPTYCLTYASARRFFARLASEIL
jgi:hypothetical protein